MIFANNNKAIINKLTRKNIKANKLRNLFAIVAIALTTILFTSLLTVGMGVAKSVQQQSLKMAGGYAHGTFENLTEEEFNRIKDHPLIEESGYSITLSMGENKEILKRQAAIRYATDTQAKMIFCAPTIGRMPLKENEIATDTMVLDLLGVPHEIGKKISIEYSAGKDKRTAEFVLCGFWESNEASRTSMLFVSRKFIDKSLAGVNLDELDENGVGTGRFSMDVMFKNSLNIQQNIETVLKDKGYTNDSKAPNYISASANWAYGLNNFGIDFKTVVSILGAGLLIIFTGYLIIYNIFQISVIKDIQYYGLLKTIGMTSKQIKMIIKKQALFLSAVGIPIGLIIGYLIGNVILPIIVNTTNITTIHISFSPFIFIGASIFSVITVFISCRKPGKIAAKVSPVQATRYVDVPAKSKTKKISLSGGKVHNMALYNILSNKKKTAVVVISMSLSLILLNSVFTFTNGFDMDKYFNQNVITDFIAGNANYFSAINSFRSEEDVISEKMVNRIAGLDGIENCGRIYYNLKHSSTRVNGQEAEIQLYGLEDFPLSQLNIIEGDMDLEKLKTGNYMIEGVYSNDNGSNNYKGIKYKIGDKFIVTYENSVSKEYEILAKAEIKYNMTVRYSLASCPIMYLPAGEFKSQIKNPLTMCCLFNVSDEYIDRTEKFLQDYTKNIEPKMDFESKRKYENRLKSTQNMFILVGGILSFIIGIIGILNFINAMLTSIISRRREFAMLQSIGMTNKQLKTMLIFEGVFYALATIVCSIILGSLVSFIVVKPIASSMWFYSYKFIIRPIFIVSPILILVSICVPYVAYIGLNNQTIVERLREAE